MPPKKIRVYELARELGLENKECLDLCERLRIGVKSHSSSIEDAQADRVRRMADAEGLRRDPIVEAPKKKAAPEVQPEPEAAIHRVVRSTERTTDEVSERSAAPMAPDVRPVVAPAARPPNRLRQWRRSSQWRPLSQWRRSSRPRRSRSATPPPVKPAVEPVAAQVEAPASEPTIPAGEVAAAAVESTKPVEAAEPAAPQSLTGKPIPPPPGLGGRSIPPPPGRAASSQGPRGASQRPSSPGGPGGESRGGQRFATGAPRPAGGFGAGRPGGGGAGAGVPGRPPEQGQALGQERPALRAADLVVAQVAALVVAVVLVRISVPEGRSGVEVLMSWSRSRYPVSPPRMLRCRKARSRYPAA